MTNQQTLILATLKGTVDGYVDLAKALVRAAFDPNYAHDSKYGRGYRDAARRTRVEHLRAMRDIQRTVHEYCKGVGYHARST